MAWYFILWLIPGEEPRGSQTFATKLAAYRYARSATLRHPTWRAQVVRHEDGRQTIVEEVST